MLQLAKIPPSPIPFTRFENTRKNTGRTNSNRSSIHTKNTLSSSSSTDDASTSHPHGNSATSDQLLMMDGLSRILWHNQDYNESCTPSASDGRSHLQRSQRCSSLKESNKSSGFHSFLKCNQVVSPVPWAQFLVINRLEHRKLVN